MNPITINSKNNSEQIIDYRNAKYQGQTNQLYQRNGLGVLIDDDLSFYLSQWKQNHLSGNTIVYLSHAKYIYGQWKDNQPHGLNVFRIGDTVLVGQLQNGQIIHRVLVIFEKFNFMAVLQKFLVSTHKSSKNYDFKVIKSGQLLSHQDLLNNIKLLNINVPQYYFSLLKFICLMVNGTIKARPMKSGHCYFGYDQGLAIIFNSNNAVVSVGVHNKGRLSQFGGKFTKNQSQQGNFQTKQTKKYKGQRPNSQIYSIFQKNHKRSLFFQNHYFCSKVKTLSSVQNLLRGKLTEIVQSARKQQRKFTVTDLNQSLDFNALNQFEEEQMNINRQNVYQNPIYDMMKKVKSQLYQGKQLIKQKNRIRQNKSPQNRSPQNRSPQNKSPKNLTPKIVRKNIEYQDYQINKRDKSPIYIEKRLQIKPKNQKLVNNKVNMINCINQDIKKLINNKTQRQQRQLSKQKSEKSLNLTKSKSKIKYLQISNFEDTLNPKQKQNLSVFSKNSSHQKQFDKEQKEQNIKNYINSSKNIQASYVDSLQQTKKLQKQLLTINSNNINKSPKSTSKIQQYYNEKQKNKEITHFKNNRVHKKKDQQNNNNQKRQKYICYESPSAKNPQTLQQQKNVDNKQLAKNKSYTKLNQSPYRLNVKYQDLNQRRSRLLQSFKNLNNQQNTKDNYINHKQIQQKQIQQHQNKSNSVYKLSRDVKTKKITIKKDHLQNKKEQFSQDSPYKKQTLQRLNSITSKNDEQQSNGCIPLSMAIGKHIQAVQQFQIQKKYNVQKSNTFIYQKKCQWENNQQNTQPSKNIKISVINLKKTQSECVSGSINKRQNKNISVLKSKNSNITLISNNMNSKINNIVNNFQQQIQYRQSNISKNSSYTPSRSQRKQYEYYFD